jgi:hypothetical protein
VVNGTVVLAKMMAFDAVERVWLSITRIDVLLLRNWLPIWSVPLGCWVAVRVVEPRSRTASGGGDCADEGGPICGVEESTVGSIVSPQLSVGELV